MHQPDANIRTALKTEITNIICFIFTCPVDFTNIQEEKSALACGMFVHSTSIECIIQLIKKNVFIIHHSITYIFFESNVS